MRFDHVSIAAVTHVDGPLRVTSEQLESELLPTLKRCGLPPGMLKGLAGIIARRWFDRGARPSDIATMAARKIFSQTQISPHQLGALINTSVCRDYLEPSTACIVHGNLGLPAHVLNFDVGNACLGFLNGMWIAAGMIETGQLNAALVVAGEDSREIVTETIARLNREEGDAEAFREQFATLTLGGGGAAMLLCRQDMAPRAPRFTGCVTRAATEHRSLSWGDRDRMFTDVQPLLAAGVDLAADTFAEAQHAFGWRPHWLDHLAMHQVSQVHTQTLCARLGLDPTRATSLFEEFGNIGPAAIPTVLSRIVEEGRLAHGQRVALMGIGSGLNCSMAEVIG